MIEQTWLLWLIGAACASALMVVMWALAVRIENASHVDVAWAYGTGAAGVLYALLGSGSTGNRLLVVVSAPYGWIALAMPHFLLVLLFRVTGIPETEAQAVRSRGDDYRRYQREVSIFVPLPPRRARA